MKIILFIAILCSCSSKSFEMEQLTEDVLKSKDKGIEIRIEPIDERKNGTQANR